MRSTRSASTCRVSGTTSSTRGLQELYRMQFGGCTASDHCCRRAVPRRDLPVPRRQRRTGGDWRDDPPRLRDPEDRQREDRVHRPYPRGDARRSSRRPGSPGSSSSPRSRPRTPSSRSCATSRVCARSSSCSIRAASRTRRRRGRILRPPNPDGYTDVNQLRQRQRARDQGDRRPASTRGSTSSSRGHTHAPYICPTSTARASSLTSASSFGRVVTDIDLVIDHQTKDVKSVDGPTT